MHLGGHRRRHPSVTRCPPCGGRRQQPAKSCDCALFIPYHAKNDSFSLAYHRLRSEISAKHSITIPEAHILSLLPPNTPPRQRPAARGSSRRQQKSPTFLGPSSPPHPSLSRQELTIQVNKSFDPNFAPSDYPRPILLLSNSLLQLLHFRLSLPILPAFWGVAPFFFWFCVSRSCSYI
jgi:hypothetical protein